MLPEPSTIRRHTANDAVAREKAAYAERPNPAFATYGLVAWAPRAEGSQYTIDLFITEGDAMMVDGKSVYVRTFSPVDGQVSLPGSPGAGTANHRQTSRPLFASSPTTA